jgi:hypothetical protein
VNAIKSFNEFLLEFLGIPTDDKLKVKAALGYKNIDLFTGEAKKDAPTTFHIQQEGELAEKYRELTPIVRSKDKKYVIDRLKELLDEIKPIQWKTEVPQVKTDYVYRITYNVKEILLILRAILESVKILQSNQIVEKNDWISRSLIPFLITIMERNGNNDMYNEMPIQVMKKKWQRENP